MTIRNLKIAALLLKIMPTTYILDTHGLLYQLFHALPPMSSPKGEPVGAVYGFTKDLFRLIERYKPDYLFCAFDLPGKTFRSELYAEYKANRSEMPDDLKPQIGFVHEILEAFGIPQLSLPGFEADDIMATVARLTAEQQGECVIVTSDKDCRQLISDHVEPCSPGNVVLLNIRKERFYKAEDLLADWGIRPDQVVDFQAFVGDSSDNVPGVAKIGQKTAAELLQQFNSLEGVYENIGKITGKKKEHLLAGKENALLSRKLVTLNNDVPIEVRWTEYQGIDRGKLRTLFQRFGFKSLMSKVETDTLLSEVGNRPLGGCVGDSRLETRPASSAEYRTLPPGGRQPTFCYHLIDTPEKFRNALAKGLGRAVRYVRETSADAVREILLDACLHCKTYDAQCEGSRADWLFKLIELTKEPDYYRAKILEAIPENRKTNPDDFWLPSYDFWQLYKLVKEFAARGDTECRTVLYREFDMLVNDNNISGADALVEIDGIPGLLHVLEIAGKRIQNGGDIWWEVSYHIEESEEKFGKDTVWNAVSAEASRNDFVRIFCEKREQVATSDHFGISIVDERMTNVLSKVTPLEEDESEKRPVEEWITGIMADNFDDDTIRNATEDDIVSWLSPRHSLFTPRRRTVSDEESEIIWSALMREENPYRLFCLLNAFTPLPRRPRLPRFDPKILNLVDSPHSFLSWKAAQVLRCFSEEAIRQKALDLLRTGPAKKHWYHGFELILSSFRAEDEEVIAASLQRHTLPDDVLHGVGYDIIQLVMKYPEVMFREPLLWLYDRTPCSLCRHNIVQELDKRQLVPKEIWEECIDDCSDELRTLAKKKYEANCVQRTFPANPLYHLIDSPEKFGEFFTQLQRQPIFSIDTETAPMENRFEATSPRYTVIVGMSFAWNDHEAWYLPFRAPLGSLTLPMQQTLEQLRPILENPSVKKIGQNLKYDCVVLRNAGVNLQGIAFDTMLADYLLRNGATHNLDDMAEHYLQYTTTKIESLIGKGKNQKRMDAVFTETIAEYAGEDALVTWHLYRILKEQIDQ